MQRIASILFAVLFVSAISGVVPMAEARNNLNGSYAFTTTQVCSTANSPLGIDASGAPTVIPASGVFRTIVVNTGVQTFNGDGTGTSVGQSQGMNISNTTVGNSIFSISDFSLSFTYTVNDDNTVDVIFGVADTTTVSGGGTGNNGTVTGTTRSLRIGNGGNTLVGQESKIQQETIVTNVLHDGTLTQYRICARSTTLAKMKHDDED